MEDRNTNSSIQRGIIFGILLGLSTALMGVFVKGSKGALSSIDVMLLRTFWLSIILLPFCYRELPVLFSKQGLSLWGRSLFGAVGLYCLFTNLQDASVSTALLLSSVSIVFVAGISIVFLRERISYLTSIGLTLVCFGLPALYASDADFGSRKTVVLGLVGALASAGAFHMLKQSTKTFRSHTIVFVMSLTICILTFLISHSPIDAISAVTDWNFVMIVIFSGATQMFLTLTYRDLSAPFAAAMAESAIFWAAGFDILYFGKDLDVRSLLLYFSIFIGLIAIKKGMDRHASRAKVSVGSSSLSASAGVHVRQ